MRVLVTGATGFVGSHTVAALTREGHDVRILVRNPDRVAGALAPHNVQADVAVGDMTDPVAVATAVAGCDAVIHAAAEIGVAGGGGTSTTNNVDGARTVISAALDAGIDPVIYTSSLTVHLPTTDAVVSPESPLAEPLSSYGASKLAAELLVRAWQAEGAPVTSFTLGGIYGPISPHRDASFAAILGALGSMMVVPPGGLGVVDVRDVAAMFVAALEPGRGPRRYLAGGQYVTWAEWTDLLSAAAGREIPQLAMTANEIIEMGRTFDAQRAEGHDSPLSEEAAVIMTSGVPTDDSATLADLRFAYRPLSETFGDTVRYLDSLGELPAAARS